MLCMLRVRVLQVPLERFLGGLREFEGAFRGKRRSHRGSKGVFRGYLCPPRRGNSAGGTQVGPIKALCRTKFALATLLIL